MSNTVDMGNMRAHLDPKTGFIRLTCTDKDSRLKREGFVVNLTPGSREYRMVAEQLMDGEGDRLQEIQHQEPTDIVLSDKYRSDDLFTVPLGIRSDKSVLHWNILGGSSKSTTGSHLSIDGATGSGKTVLLHSILDHLNRHRKSTRVLFYDGMGGRFVYHDILRHLEMPDEHIAVYADEDTSFLHKAHRMMRDRAQFLEQRGVSAQDAIREGTLDAVFVVVDEYSRMRKKMTKDEKILWEHMLAHGHWSGVHVLVTSQDFRFAGADDRMMVNIPCSAHFRGRHEGTEDLRTGKFFLDGEQALAFVPDWND